MKNYQVTGLRFLLVILGSLSISACSGQPQAAVPPPISVKIDRVKTTEVKETTEYNARVEGIQNATLQPRVSGWVKQVYVRLGQQVNQGDLILEIDQAQQQANLESQVAVIDSRQAELASAQATLESQQAQLERVRSEKEFESQSANLVNAQQSLQAQIQEKQRLEYERQYLSEGADLQDARDNVNAAVRELERRKAVAEFSQKELARYENLLKEGVSTRQVYDRIVRDFQTAQADVANQEDLVASAQARVRSAEQDLRRTVATLTSQIETQQKLIQAEQASVEAAKRDYERQVTTLDSQITSQEKVVEAAQADLRRLQQEINQARADATAEQVELEYYQITAPISGIVGDIVVKRGDYVSSETVLSTIRQNNQLEVQINIPVNRLSQIRTGTVVELLSQETGELIGTSRVSYVSPSAGTGTQTILVKALYDNQNNKLRTDQIVRARVIWEQNPGVTVPTTAISRIGAQSFVFIAEEQTQDGKTTLVAKQRPVKLGSIQDQSYHILSGVKSGEIIVTDGVIKLRDGAPIIDQSTAKPAPAQ